MTLEYSATQLEEAYAEAEVLQLGHVILNSGRHSDIKLDMEQLLHHPPQLKFVMGRVRQRVAERDIDGLLPVQRGAHLLACRTFTREDTELIESRKLGSREFTISTLYAKRAIRRAERLGIFDDALTTGGTPAALAAQVHKINPEVELELYGICLRGEILPEHAKHFTRMTFLSEMPLPSWAAEDCKECPLDA